jgi:hypothetical protein
MLRLGLFSWLPVILLLTVGAHAGVPGSFRGTIIAGPHSSTGNWIYVQGRNGAARRVEVSGAHVEYDEDAPPAARSRAPQDALVVGADVRVTAEQGSDGEWKATRIEILTVASEH